MRNVFSWGRCGIVATVILSALVSANVLSQTAVNSVPANSEGSSTVAEKTASTHSGVALDASKTIATGGKRTPLRILVVGAHPADAFDQSGGTMAHHIERGDWVGCAVMTTGIRVHDKVMVDDIQRSRAIPELEQLKKQMAQRAEVKQKEVIHACSILGVRQNDIYFLGADDAVLLVNEKTIRELAKLIRHLRPHVILTHFPYVDGGLGSQHATTGQIVMYAMPLASTVDPDDKTPPHKVTQVFFFGTDSACTRTHLWDARGGHYNDVFVDITDVAAKKVACLDAMASQGYDGVYARKRIETTDGAFGNAVKIPYAEGFISLYSTTHYYLPISEINLQYSSQSDHQSIERRSYRVNVP